VSLSFAKFAKIVPQVVTNFANGTLAGHYTAVIAVPACAGIKSGGDPSNKAQEKSAAGRGRRLRSGDEGVRAVNQSGRPYHSLFVRVWARPAQVTLQPLSSAVSYPAFGTLRSKPTKTSNSPARAPSGTGIVTVRTAEK